MLARRSCTFGSDISADTNPACCAALWDKSPRSRIEDTFSTWVKWYRKLILYRRYSASVCYHRGIMAYLSGKRNISRGDGFALCFTASNSIGRQAEASFGIGGGLSLFGGESPGRGFVERRFCKGEVTKKEKKN